jgi:hypothetical protein
VELAERRRRPNGQRRTWGWDKIRIRQLSSGNLGGRGRLEPACPLAAMPSDAVPILVPGPKVQHGVLSLQTAHANEAAYADGRRGFEWRNGGGTEPERASAGYTLAIQHHIFYFVKHHLGWEMGASAPPDCILALGDLLQANQVL